MNEARGIWFSHFYDENGQDHSFTLRQDAEGDEAFVDRVVEFQQILVSKGFYPIAKYSPKGPVSTNDENVAQSVAQELGGEVGPKFIEVETISLASGGEHPRWVIKGGWAKKYGITCWPEVLEDAKILEHLDPLTDNTPQGKWYAFYTEKMRDGEMKADKVIRLEKQ